MASTDALCCLFLGPLSHNVEKYRAQKTIRLPSGHCLGGIVSRITGTGAGASERGEGGAAARGGGGDSGDDNGETARAPADGAGDGVVV